VSNHHIVSSFHILRSLRNDKAMGLTSAEFEFDYRQGYKLCVFSTPSRPVLGPTQSTFSGHRG